MADMDPATFYATVPARYPELRGRVAIVTGSSRGIGKGIALRLGREGMKVVINSRTAEAVAATTAELRALGIEALAVPADLGRTEEIDRLFAETLRAFGAVDVLVNNAADLRRVEFFEMDEELLDHQLAANIRGPYVASMRAARLMREQGRGSIIHISSVGGTRAHWRGRRRAQPAPGGRLEVQPVCVSKACAVRRRSASANGRPTSCRPTGMPRESKPMGTESAGRPR